VRTTANIISIVRIVLALGLFWVRPLSVLFYAIYLICVISDMLDGYVARKTHTESKVGEKLDSVSDLIMFVVLAIILFPIINPTRQIISWIVIIGMVRVVSMMVVLVKYKTFAILHTYGNKITGFVLSLLPLSLAFIQIEALVYIICVIASISAIEELFIHLSSSELRANRKSIFEK